MKVSLTTSQINTLLTLLDQHVNSGVYWGNKIQHAAHIAKLDACLRGAQSAIPAASRR